MKRVVFLFYFVVGETKALRKSKVIEPDLNHHYTRFESMILAITLQYQITEVWSRPKNASPHPHGDTSGARMGPNARCICGAVPRSLTLPRGPDSVLPKVWDEDHGQGWLLGTESGIKSHCLAQMVRKLLPV